MKEKNIRIFKSVLTHRVGLIWYAIFICVIFLSAPVLHAGNKAEKNITNYIKCYFNDYIAGLPYKMKRPKAQANGIDKALYNFIDKASSSLDCMIYEFDDVTLATKLADKHKSGVNVRIVFDKDNFESDQNNDACKIIIKAGIKPILNTKQHNKVIIVDNDKVLTGSMNFTKRGMCQNANQITIINDRLIAKAYTLEFNQMYEHPSRHKKKKDNNDEDFKIGGSEVHVYFNPKDNLTAELCRYISNANTSIRISMFSLTHDPIYKKLLKARDRGVSVLGVYDYRGACHSSSEVNKLIEKKCGYVDANPGLMHNKWAIFDNKIIWLGSANWSKSGLTTGNDENVVVIHNADIAKKFFNEWEKYYNDAKDYQENYQKKWARTEIHHYDWDRKWVKGAVVKFLGWSGCEYQIFRSETKDGKYIKIDSVTPKESAPYVPKSARFIDKNATSEMYYKVKTCGASEHGNIYHPEPGEIGPKKK